MVKSCTYYGCHKTTQNSPDGTVFVQIPKPWADIDRAEKWLEQCGTLLPLTKISNDTRVCSNHFPLDVCLDWKINQDLEPFPNQNGLDRSLRRTDDFLSISFDPSKAQKQYKRRRSSSSPVGSAVTPKVPSLSSDKKYKLDSCPNESQLLQDLSMSSEASEVPTSMENEYSGTRKEKSRLSLSKIKIRMDTEFQHALKGLDEKVINNILDHELKEIYGLHKQVRNKFE